MMRALLRELTINYLIAASSPNVKMKPTMIPKEVKWSFPCSWAIGISLSTVMNTITPAAKDNEKGINPEKSC
jgi:hypothetical protein